MGILNIKNDDFKLPVLKLRVTRSSRYILPKNAFGSYDRRKGKQKPETLVRHIFAGSWKKDKNRADNLPSVEFDPFKH